MPTGGELSQVSSGRYDKVIVPELPFWRQVGIIATCMIVMINNIGSGPAIVVALPSLAPDLKIDSGKLQWVVSAYALTSGCFLLLFGKVADVYGRRRTLLAGCFWMGCWAIGCALAPTEIGLDTMRGLQGIGPAMGVPAALGILAQTFAEGSQMRNFAFSAFGSAAPIGAALGVTVGGFLTQWTGPGWKSAFYYQAAIAFFNFALGVFFLQPDSETHLAPVPVDASLESRPRIISTRSRINQIDWLGAFSATSGILLITFALGDGEDAPQGWKTPYVDALLVLGVLLMVFFVWWELRLNGMHDDDPSERDAGALDPLLKMAIFKRDNGRLAAMVAVAFFIWASFSGWIFYAVLYYQQYLGLGPVLSMIRMLPLSPAGVICTVVVALSASRVPGIVLLVIGCSVMSLSPLLFAVQDASATYWAFGFPASVFSVFGSDLVYASGSIFVARVSLPQEQSLAGGLFNTLAQVGTSIGLSLQSIVLDRVIVSKAREMGFDLGTGSAALNAAPKEALLKGIRAVMWMSVGYSLMALLLSVLFLRNMGIISPPQVKAKKDSEASSLEKIEA